MTRFPTIAAVAGTLLLAACGPGPGPTPTPSAAAQAKDGWYDFGGSWNATGRSHTIAMGGERSATLVDLRGSLLLSGSGRPGAGFGAEALVLADSQTGMIGRAVWTDEDGNHVYSELRGDGTRRGNRITGTIVGGTGRFAGATGAYGFTWQYVLETDDGTMQGRTLDLAGRVHLPPRTPPTEAGGARP